MRKPDFCQGENKGAYQLGHNHETDQHLCFSFMDSTIPLLPYSKNTRFLPSSETIQVGLCQIWSETTKTGLLASQLKII